MKHEEKIKLLKTIVDDSQGAPCDQIYRIEAEGQPYTFATDARRLLAFEADGVLDAIVPKFEDLRKDRIVKPNLQKWLSHKEGLQPISFYQLRHWCQASEFTICPCCSGSGTRPVDFFDRYEFDEDFALTDIRGVDDKFKREGSILGMPLDLHLLVRTIAHLPEQEMIQVALLDRTKPEAVPPVLFAGRGWKYLQMPLDPKTVKDAEEFEGLLAAKQ
jgi:hypothetical protein